MNGKKQLVEDIYNISKGSTEHVEFYKEEILKLTHDLSRVNADKKLLEWQNNELTKLLEIRTTEKKNAETKILDLENLLEEMKKN